MCRKGNISGTANQNKFNTYILVWKLKCLSRHEFVMERYVAALLLAIWNYEGVWIMLKFIRSLFVFIIYIFSNILKSENYVLRNCPKTWLAYLHIQSSDICDILAGIDLFSSSSSQVHFIFSRCLILFVF